MRRTLDSRRPSFWGFARVALPIGVGVVSAIVCVLFITACDPEKAETLNSSSGDLRDPRDPSNTDGAAFDASQSREDGSADPRADASGGDDAGREAGPSTPGCGVAPTPGSTSEKIVVNGVERKYLKDIPTGIGANTPVPLILGFHGGSDTAENAKAYMQLTSTDAAIYIYPQAPFWPEAGGVAWNVDPAGVDFPFIDALLEEVGKKHCVDKSRIFATGKSNGGFFVNSLACYRADVFRAVAVVAGGGPQSNCAKGMAAMIVHGTADTAVRFEQGEYSRDFWRTKNTCLDTTAPTDPNPCVAYAGCTKPVRWCPHNGAHIWPSWAGAGVRGFFLGM